MIVLSNGNVREIILNILTNKAKAYRYCCREGDIQQADKCYEQWIAIAQVCDALGITYPSISEVTTIEF